MSSNVIVNSECCPRFEPNPWNEKTFDWDNKKFIRDRVVTMFYLPVNFGAVISRMTKKVQNSGAGMPDWLCLSDHTSKWSMDLFLAVDKEITDAENVTMTGKFMSKVYEGDFKETKAWSEDFKAYVKENGFSIKKWYMWYTTCPKCAKKYGKNYVVIIAEVESL